MKIWSPFTGRWEVSDSLAKTSYYRKSAPVSFTEELGQQIHFNSPLGLGTEIELAHFPFYIDRWQPVT
jgi:hypothetical protein